jgi:hypothetical protein
MSDFFSLVQKLHAIEANEKPTTVNESATVEVSPERKEVMETASILRELDAIEVTPKSVAEVKTDRVFEAKKDEVEIDVEETMKDRFAKFLKAERQSGVAVEEIKSMIDEGTAEYEYADRAFLKIAETINTLEQMVREGGMLETKIAQAGGDVAALADMRQALSDAYDACEDAHQDALGSATHRGAAAPFGTER